MARLNNGWIFDGTRSPFGRCAGSLAAVRPDDLMAMTAQALFSRHPQAREKIEDVYLGCANQAGEDSRCISRHAGLLAGLPIESAGVVFQRNCGSGLQAVISAAHAIEVGEAQALLVGGVESMSRAPIVMSKAESAYSKDQRIFDSALGARFPNPQIETKFGAHTMPETADNLAVQFGLTRERCDNFALRSQQRAARAQVTNRLAREISSVRLPPRRGNQVEVLLDEHPRPETTLESLARLRPLFDGGVTTAGNASGINDGAVALLMGSDSMAEMLGLKPLGRVIATATAGVEPRIMGYGPVPASQRALARAGISLRDVEVIEINEAFAAQVLACTEGLGLSESEDRLNPNGGAIALGHPLGASGPRLLLTALHELELR
ncbi:MAG: acetyl-CoA C-acyltransferase, partial [Burkholderiaceae bacterium]